MAWFIRKQRKVTGPFPDGQLKQLLILGRLSIRDEISKDQQEWTPICDYPELIPDVLLESSEDEQAAERLQAARRWADERRTERRLEEDPIRTGPGRRDPEGYATQEYREHREGLVVELKSRKESFVIGLFLTTVLLVFGAIAGFLWEPTEIEGAECLADARAEVNWSDCPKANTQQINQNLSNANLSGGVFYNANFSGSNMQGADLAYGNFSLANLSRVNLSGARLIGADMHNADLSETNFSSADLSLADFRGANIEKTNFMNANLSNAIWIDGQICLKGSIGRCVAEKQ